LILLNQQSLKDWAIKHKMPTPQDAHYLGQVLDGQVRAVVVYCGFLRQILHDSCRVRRTALGN